MRLPRVRRSFVLPGVIIALSALVVGAGAAAAFESDTVGSYWEGLWWALALMTTVGFVEGTPTSVGGAVTSALLMVAGFLLLSLISAALASLFVREDEEPAEEREEALEQQVLERLAAIEQRIAAIEQRLGGAGSSSETPVPRSGTGGLS
ncbi:ion channel [Nocardioides sp. MAHUQ-72]|uniref:ion channel n=1 Tax=unclassified Nocardioides TaxID=2615069 RepID=UPI003607D445